MLFLSALLACGPACFSQQAEKFPLGDYVELTDTKPHDGEEVWSKMTAPVRFCWGTTDVRYKKLNVPDVKATFLFFHLHLYNYFADITLADTGSMAIFGEIDGELSRIDLGVGCRTVDIESDVFLLVIRS